MASKFMNKGECMTVMVGLTLFQVKGVMLRTSAIQCAVKLVIFNCKNC